MAKGNFENVVALIFPFQAAYFPMTSVDHPFLLFGPYIGTTLSHKKTCRCR